MILEEETFERFGYYSTDLSSHSHKKIVVACDDCGKVRLVMKQDYRALCLHCARKGAKNPHWGGGKVKRVCENCGTEFPVAPSDIKNGRGRFCSTKCMGKWYSQYRRGENHPGWKGGEAMRICEQCGVEFPVKHSKVKSGGGKFCSPQCYGKWQSEHQKGENNPAWKNGASFEPYCHKFNEDFKEYIRDKFRRVCFLCPKTEEENGQRLSVHHVNGNKNCGCDDDETCQFVPLCVSCHGKMLSKKVDWEKKINDMLHNKLNGWYI